MTGAGKREAHSTDDEGSAQEQVNLAFSFYERGAPYDDGDYSVRAVSATVRLTDWETMFVASQS